MSPAWHMLTKAQSNFTFFNVNHSDLEHQSYCGQHADFENFTCRLYAAGV